MYGAKWIWQQSFKDKTFKECTQISQPSFSWTGYGCMVTECAQRELLQLLKFLVVLTNFCLKNYVFAVNTSLGNQSWVMLWSKYLIPLE